MLGRRIRGGSRLPGKSSNPRHAALTRLPVPLPLPQPGRRPMRRAAGDPLYILGRINPPCGKILAPYRAKMLGRRIRGGSGSARESLLNPRQPLHGLPAPLPLPHWATPLVEAVGRM